MTATNLGIRPVENGYIVTVHQYDPANFDPTGSEKTFVFSSGKKARAFIQSLIGRTV